MKSFKTLTPPIKATIMAFAFAGIASADPVDYWFLMLNEDGSAAQPDMDVGKNFALEDGTRVEWQDGNVLRWASREWPAAVAALNPKVNNGSIKSATLKAYGMTYNSGDRTFSGNGRLEIGAGGFLAPKGWGTFKLQLKGGLHLSASQTWSHACDVRFECPLTAEDGVVWTAASTTANTLVIATTTTLPGCELVLGNSEKLSLVSQTASLGLDALTIDGTKSRIVLDATKHAKTLNADYAKEIHLRNGASLGSAQGFNEVELDLDALVIDSGASTLGEGATYWVKDGGEQTVEVKAGAALTLISLPTSGTLVLTGEGDVLIGVSDPTVLPTGLRTDGFDGTVKATVVNASRRFATLDGAWFNDLTLTDSEVGIDDLAGYSGVITANGATCLVLSPTETWPAAFALTLADTAQLILPEGYSVDETKILGTKNYSAVGKGYDKVAEDVTIGAGEEYVVAFDGFTADTKITLNGGTITFPVPATIASDIDVTATSSIGAKLRVVGTVSGSVAVDARLNADSAVKRLSSDVSVGGWAAGRVVFSGGGAVAATASLVDNGGELEFQGGTWTFTGALGVEQKSGDYNGIGIYWTKGAKADFGPNDANARSGLYTGSNGYYPVTLAITEGSVVRFDKYRMLRLGNGNWRHMTDLIVDNATLKLESNDGQFGLSEVAYKDNRTPMGTIIVRNGGVIETDRVLDSIPVNHGLDGNPFVGRNFVAGLHLTLDGGTYRLGSLFGADADAWHSKECCNHLFAMTPSGNKSTEADLHHTAEIEVTIGANGGTFDLSQANVKDHSFTNAILHATIGDYPCLGPRWIVNGPLTVKGNGSQEFVLNGLTQGQLKNVTADGAVVKVVGDFGESYDAVTLGAAGGGVKVEDESDAAQTLAIAKLTVAAGGAFDAANFDGAVTTVGELEFGENAALCASNANGAVPQLASIGSVTLASAMGYSAAHGLQGKVNVLSADSILPAGGEGVTWTKASGSNKTVEVTEDGIDFTSFGLLLLVR